MGGECSSIPMPGRRPECDVEFRAIRERLDDGKSQMAGIALHIQETRDFMAKMQPCITLLGKHDLALHGADGHSGVIEDVKALRMANESLKGAKAFWLDLVKRHAVVLFVVIAWVIQMWLSHPIERKTALKAGKAVAGAIENGG